MARPADRMRLKDKLVDNVSKGIKLIQENFYYHAANGMTRSLEENTIIIDNRSHACHKLLDSLDHALLHGIRNVTHGYWRVVKQLSHKGMVSDIESLPSVTTDLGRGRAWLHASLNEALLESYIRLLTENEKLVKKHYAKDSLVMDKDRMNVLLTLTSGLDFVTFQLEYDLPYLDLSPSPPRTRSELYEERDSPFLQSSNSRSSFTEPRLPSPVTRVPLQSDSDSTSVSSYDVQSQSDGKDGRSLDTFNPQDSVDIAATGKSMQSIAQGDIDARESKTFASDFGNARSITPNDSTSVSSFGSTGDVDRHKRLENILAEAEDLDNMGNTLEVIHIRGKKVNSSKKTKKKKPRSNSVEVETAGPPRRNSRKESLPQKEDVCEEAGKLSLKEACSYKNEQGRDEAEDKPEACKPLHLPQIDSGSDISMLSSSFQRSSDATPIESACEDSASSGGHPVKEASGVENSLLSTEVSAFSEIEKRIAALCGTADESLETRMNVVSENSSRHFPGNNDNVTFAHMQYDQDGKSENIPPNASSSAFPHHKSEEKALVITENGRGSSHCLAIPDIAQENVSQHEMDENFDFYSSSFHEDAEDSNATRHSLSTSKNSEKSNKQIVKMHEASHLQDYVDYILTSPESPDVTINDVPDNPPDLCIRLDNNMKLQVMLDIFKQEDESFVKMFVCWENHTEGDPAIAYVLVSDHYLYILHLNRHSRKFVVQSTTRLLDIIFISTGLHDQTLNIESRGKSRQKQRLWLTPGYQALTQAIVECLTEAVKKAVDNFASVKSRFSVGSDVPLQKIGLRKYLCKLMNCESQDISIKDYSLVYWEDPSSSSSSGSLDAVTKEGTLLLHTQDPLKEHIWKPVYVVIRSGMLCISNKKSDPKPHSYLGLGGDQCIGCRRATVGDRQNCMELVMAQAGSWFLTAATSSEIVEWTHALCMAVSQGIQEEGSLKDCTPCCSVLACNKIFMCHEDLRTRFFRTLGSAQVEDVTGISLDKDERTYCVVEFESTEAGVVSGQWIFYFVSASDASRFVSALGICWKDVYKVDLPIATLDNITLQRHCQKRVKHLRNALTVL